MIREFTNVIDLKEKQETYDIVIWVLGLTQTLLHCVGGWVNSVIEAASDSFSVCFISVWIEPGHNVLDIILHPWRVLKYICVGTLTTSKIRIWCNVHAPSNIGDKRKKCWCFSPEYSLKGLKETVSHSIKKCGLNCDLFSQPFYKNVCFLSRRKVPIFFMKYEKAPRPFYNTSGY